MQICYNIIIKQIILLGIVTVCVHPACIVYGLGTPAECEPATHNTETSLP